MGGGLIVRTTDAAATWTRKVIGTTIYGVSFTDPNTGTAVGSHGTILRTFDGGVTWTRANCGTAVELLWHLLH